MSAISPIISYLPTNSFAVNSEADFVVQNESPETLCFARLPVGQKRMSLTAMLMAGGESRRMGVDKATMVFEGEWLWQKQIRLLKSLKPAELWISARARPEWCPREAETIIDAAPSCGPLSGIAAGLSQLRTSHLVVLAVDMPKMLPQHLTRLLDLASDRCGVVPRKANLFEPLCAVYPVEASFAAGQALARRGASLQSLMGDLLISKLVRAYDLSEAEIPLYRNLNTPDDLVEH